MNQRRWILAAAAVLGLLLAVIAGVFLWHEMGKDYADAKAVAVSAADGSAVAGDMSGQGAGGQGGAGSQDATGDQGNAGFQGAGFQNATGGAGSQDVIGGQGDTGPQDTAGGQGSTGSQDTTGGQGGTDSVLRFVFAGDVLLSDHVLAAYERGGGIRGVVDEELQAVIDTSDIFMVNEEFPFSDRGSAAADKQYTFRLPPEKVSMFHELGIDIVSLANNHALDFGTDALLDTCRTLDEAGIYRVGAGKNLEEAKQPVILEIKGKKIGFLGASRVIPEGSWNASSTKPGMLTTYDPALLLEEIKKVRETCDYVIVYVHWGIERHDRPEEYQRSLGQQYIDAGADIVIGSHPHVLQGLEYYKGKPIVYSLGNFVFGSSIPKSMLLTVDWDGQNVNLALVPATSSAGYTRAVTDEGQKAAFFQYMTDLSYEVTVGEDGSVSEKKPD